MKAEVDEAKFAAKLNSMLDVPYIPESVEAQAIEAVVAAAAKALANVVSGSESAAEYGVTVEA